MLVTAVQVLTTVVVAVAMASALAHALELPGMFRLSKEQYLAVQPIYYPGFTIAGAAEPLALILVVVLGLMTPTDTAAFWLTVAAFIALAAMHATYWLVTHPVNNFWLKGFKLSGLGLRFFAMRRPGGTGGPEEVGWTVLRDRWERSHVVRAVFGLAGLVFLATALAI